MDYPGPLEEFGGPNLLLFAENAPIEHVDFVGLYGRSDVDALLGRVNDAVEEPLNAAAAGVVSVITNAVVRFAQTHCSTKVSFALFGGGKLQLPLAPNPLVPDVLFEVTGAAQGDLVYYWNNGLGSDRSEDYDLNGDLKISGVFGLRWEKDLSMDKLFHGKAFGEIAAGRTWRWNMLTLASAGTDWGGYARFVTEWGAKRGNVSELSRNEVRFSIGGDGGQF